MNIHIELANSYGKTKGAALAASKATRNVDSMRCELDSIACGIPGGGPSVYYPGPNRQKEEA